jgi:putative ABC transport system permease protein
VKGADGSSPEQLAGRANLTDIIITDNLACQLFPGRSAVGEWVKNTLNGDSVRIAAVCENQKYNEFTSHQRATYIPLHFTQKRPFYYLEAPYLGVYIRVHPDSDGDDFIRRFRKDMREQLMIGNFYLEDMRPMTDFRNEQLKEPRNDLYTYLSVAVFFLLNAFLAVLGTFWFRTQQRRSELGLRVALGGSRVSLCRLLWGEGVVLLTLAFIPAIVVAANLGLAEIVSDYPVEFTLFRFVAGIFITYLLLVFTVFLAVWIPARQAMKIQPAEALREE